jgi:hypothetical protein
MPEATQSVYPPLAELLEKLNVLLRFLEQGLEEITGQEKKESHPSASPGGE